MAERKSNRNVEPGTSSSSNSNHSNSRLTVNPHLQRVQNKRRQEQRRPEESIYMNTLSLAHNQVNPASNFGNFTRGYYQYQYVIPQQLYQNINPYIYRNFSQAIHVQQNLSQTCFHRPNLENQQRQVQTTSRNADSTDISLKGLRFWERISPRKNKQGFVFSVMSYNILAQDLIDQHPHLYSYHRKESLKWEIRWKNLLAEIKHFNPDILCFQEVQGSHVEPYFSFLENLGYRGIYKQRTGIRTDGCAIYYKQDLVTLIEHTTVEYNQPNIPILDRDNVAIIAKFVPKKHPKQEFVVATTHLLYNPKRQDVRLAQTLLLLTEVDRIAFKNGHKGDHYLPVIVTGDLNSTPDSVVYQFITKGKLKYENLASRSLQKGTNGPKTGKNFLPSSLRITDQCQHADLIPKRQKNKTIPRSEELKLIELKHSERQYKETKNGNRNDNDPDLFSSGTLTHKLFLESVYKHGDNGDTEGTTYQDEWISVDYIFYSKKKPDLGKLTLLERYKLPTRSQLDNVRIPNAKLGSDHLSLLAKFELEI